MAWLKYLNPWRHRRQERAYDLLHGRLVRHLGAMRLGNHNEICMTDDYLSGMLSEAYEISKGD